MMSARTVKTWYLLHSWSSLACTVFLLLLCVTGLPLIFEHEIEDWLEQRVKLRDIAPATPAASLDRIVAAGRERYPGQYIRILFWDREDGNIVKLSVVPRPEAEPRSARRVLLDARSAEVLGEEPPRGGFLWTVLELHRNLLIGPAGEWFLAFVGLLFVVALVSGTVLYGPFMRRLAFGSVRRHAARVRWLDLHNLLGIVTLAWALVVGATGVMNALAKPLFAAWRAEVMPALLAPHRGKPAPEQLRSVDEVVEAARKALPDTTILSVVFPNQLFATSRHYVVWTKGNTPLTSRLYTPALIDAETGVVTHSRGLPWYLRTLQVSRPLHFGDYGGLPLKVLWALLDVICIVVLASGLYLWVVRRRTPLAVRLAEIDAGLGERPLGAG